jgi:hypothetical protein
MVGQGGVVGLLPRRRGTGEGREAGLATAFDGSDNAPVIGSSSGDVLQHQGGEAKGGGRRLSELGAHREDESATVLLLQGEATGEVRGELNQSGRLQRRRSPSQGGDGSGGSKSDGRRWTGCRGG